MHRLVYQPNAQSELMQTLNEHLKLFTICAYWASIILKLSVPRISIWAYTI